MKITNGIQSDVYKLCQEMQAYGVQVLADESSKDSIQATLERKEIRGVVTLDSVDESMTFALHRLRPNGAYIKESFRYDPSLQKWHFRNSIALQTQNVYKIFDYIFSAQHENSI